MWDRESVCVCVRERERQRVCVVGGVGGVYGACSLSFTTRKWTTMTSGVTGKVLKWLAEIMV